MSIFRRPKRLDRESPELRRYVIERDDGCVWCQAHFHDEKHIKIYDPILCWKGDQPFMACRYHKFMWEKFPKDHSEERKEMEMVLGDWLIRNPLPTDGRWFR